jgi:hypothetical protein
MTAAVESMAYRQAHGTPWHRLGVSIDRKVTAKEIIEIAAMNYQVQLMPMVANMPDGTQVMTDTAGIFSNRTGEWQYLNSVKRAKNYMLVQNAEIGEILDAGEDNALSAIFDMDTAGVLAGGKHTFFSLHMGKDTVKIGVDGNDEYETNMFIFNDFSGSGQLQWGMSYTRIVCLNTALMALNEADKDNTLWTFPHRGNPLAMLKYRAELERHLQASRKGFYMRLQAMVDNKWDVDKVDTFVNKMYPDPKTPRVVLQRNAGIGYDMPEDIVKPVEARATVSERQHESNMERAKDNRTLLKDRIDEYANEFSGYSMYAAYQGATEVINWRIPERGTWDNVAESVLFDSRRVEMDRLNRLVGLLPSKKRDAVAETD